MRKVVYYIVPVLICLAVGALSAILQHPSIEEWYPLLDKPSLTPPDIAFPIAWGIIYICMGISLGRLLSLGYRRITWLWGAQLVLNPYGLALLRAVCALARTCDVPQHLHLDL